MDRLTKIKTLMEKALAPTYIDIIDESHLHKGHAGAAGGAGHFAVTVISNKFKDKSAIQRHRMVYATIAELIPTEIHALRIQAHAEEQG